MSKYTTEVRYICESKSGFTPQQLSQSTPLYIVQAARNAIFDPNIIVGSEEYSNRIKETILLHYYTREICEETFALWKLRMNTRLREKRDYYTALYETIEKQAYIGEHPFEDVNISTDRHEDNKEDSAGGENVKRVENSKSADAQSSVQSVKHSDSDVETIDYGKKTTSSKTDYNLHSDTPEGSVDGINAVIHNLEGSGFLSDAQKNTSDTTEELSQSDVTTTDYGHKIDSDGAITKDRSTRSDSNADRSYADSTSGERKTEETIVGKRSSISMAVMLKQYRAEIMNLDEMIVNDFRDLFMQIW